jgi:hypothetical protein
MTWRCHYKTRWKREGNTQVGDWIAMANKRYSITDQVIFLGTFFPFRKTENTFTKQPEQ